MKKVLLTSTALVMASATFAAADIAISGSAEMGLAGATADLEISNNDDVSVDLPMQFFQDLDVTFSMSGETDGGLAFGASIDLDEVGGNSNSVDNNFDDGGVAIFISGDFGTLTMGDTDGALDFVITDAGNIGNPGSLDDAETAHLGYLGGWLDGSGDGQIVRYDYAFDAFQFAVSVEQMPSTGNGVVNDGDDDLTWGIAVGYDYDFGSGSVDFGLGYQYSDDGRVTFSLGGIFGAALGLPDDPNTGADEAAGEFQLGGGEVGATAIGAAVNLDNGIAVGFTYTNFNFDEGSDVEHIGIGGGYAFDAFSIGANWGQYTGDDQSVYGWGIAAAYDLGGGAAIKAGYGESDFDLGDVNGDGGDETFTSSNYSFGLSFSF